ncbi:MAG: SH3 domain-containing protein [Agathobacter sp.]|nr:SH3 domain-containing protein [Agathobacter sp.]
MKDILDKVKKICEEKVLPAIKKVGEKVKEIPAKVKPIIEKVKPVLAKIVPFVVRNKRYFATAGLFVCLILVMMFFTGDAFNAKRIAKLNSKEVTGEQYVPDEVFEVDAYPELNELIKKYFVAYVNADFATLETLATPISNMEKSYITTMSQFYEEYRNVTCYTKHGLSKDSYIVSACFDIKFTGHDLTAPSMVLFYVQTAEDGSLYINNLYSDFNMYYSETSIRKDVYTALIKYTTQEDYLELYSNVETAFNDLIKENTDVYQLTKRTIPGVRQQWEDSVYYVEQETETVGSTEIVTPQETPESEGTGESQGAQQTPEPETEPEAENRVDKVRCTRNDVNVRKKASPSGSRLGKANQGNEFVKLGVEEDENGDEWTKIQFTDDEVGYIISSYMEDVED